MRTPEANKCVLTSSQTEVVKLHVHFPPSYQYYCETPLHQKVFPRQAYCLYCLYCLLSTVSTVSTVYCLLCLLSLLSQKVLSKRSSIFQGKHPTNDEFLTEIISSFLHCWERSRIPLTKSLLAVTYAFPASIIPLHSFTS